MREAIIIGVVVGVLFFAAGAVMTALAVKYATSAILWDVVLWSGVGLMAASIASLALYIWSQTTGGPFWVPAMLMNLGVCAVVSGISYSYTNIPAGDQLPAPKFSWIWDPLTEAESRKLTEALREQKPNTLLIAGNRRISGKLLDSLHVAFRAAGWSTQNMSAGQVIQEGVSGALIAPDNEVSRAVKTAIEANTPLRLAVVLPRYQNSGVSLGLVIGGKIPPSPMPEEIRKDLAEFGTKLKQLSKEISHLVSDRQTGQELLPKRETFSPDMPGLSQWWNIRRDYDQRTEALFAERFGAEVLVCLTRLDILGIETPFAKDRAEDRGKWFGLIGDLLEKRDVVQAQERGSDPRFWWGK